VRFAFIAAEKVRHSLTRLCRCLRVTRSGFYAWRDRPLSPRAQRDVRLRVQIRAFHAGSRGSYGSPRIWKDLQEAGEAISRKRVIRLMQAEGLHGQVRRRFVPTTDSTHSDPIAANRLARQFDAPGPNQRWVSDTTQFVMPHGQRLYLAVVMDLFSRFVVGWAVSAVNDRRLTIQALEAALTRRAPAPGLLLHSDRGCTYTAEDYQRALAAHGIVCSMSRRGNCYDNAVSESFFKTVKVELSDRFPSYSEAKMALFDYIEVFYNQRRRHSTLGLISPAAFERRHATAAAEAA
jgi:transposase InsO family protein